MTAVKTLSLLWLMPSAFGQRSALYEYDTTTPFEYREQVTRRDATVEIAGASVRSPKGGRLNMLVVRPRGTGPYAGIIYQHGGGQTMMTYIAEAEVMARAGAISLIVDAPGSGPGRPEPPADKGAAIRESFIHMTVCYRRAIDYLQSLKTVDPKRIAFVGHSYGGVSGSALIAVDERVRAFVLVGIVARYTRHVETKDDYWSEWRKGMSPEQLAAAQAQFRVIDPDNFVGAARHAPILLQCGSLDVINVDACLDLEKLTSTPREVRWYDTDHDFSDIEVITDRMRFVGDALGLKGLKAQMDRLWTAPARRATPTRMK
jgi:pimeloyl-ACP methyl ester carboxylesterase